MAKILVVDDEAVVRGLLRGVLEAAGHSVAEAVDGNDAVEQQDADPADLVIVDLVMPVRNGIDTVAAMRDAHPDTRFIVMTGALPELFKGNSTIDEIFDGAPKLTKPMT